uniref:Carrier domain-containing protein n=1 Tax=Bionectria ochroleuca TaxID=29856 RepID=A0A8H7MZD3_BIOOC
MNKSIALQPSAHRSITKATIMRAAWALVLAQYCETDDICFGTSVSGRQAPVSDVTNILGPVVTTLPVRVLLDGHVSISSFLQKIQSQATEMIPYEQYGLQNIFKLGEDIRQACTFSSLLVIQPYEKMSEVGSQSTAMMIPSMAGRDKSQAMDGYFTFPLVVQALLSDTQIDLNITYNSAHLTEGQMTGLISQLAHVIEGLNAETTTALRDLSITSPWDVEMSTKLAHNDVEIVNSTFHDLFAEQARIRPDAIAIRAWDRTFSYGEVERYTNSLAAHLVHSLKVQRGDLVHVCFEKSAWYFISILAINKAGAAWVPLDPSQPQQRQQQVVSQTKSTLILTSRRHEKMSSKLIDRVLEVDPKFMAKLPKKSVKSLSSPGDACYVIFTSGSTGVPKGFVMEHRAVCTSQTEIASRLKLNQDVNMIQFASFVFDLSIGEIIGPLIMGATVCVPSDEMRMSNHDLVSFINETNVTWFYLTPSFARSIRPESVPSLKLLLFAGEAVGRDVFETWVTKVRLINGWGPAETCCFSAIHEWTSVDESPLTIGRPVGSQCWIVSPDDPTKLSPVGTLGEVLIQGPTLLREYLGDPKRTAETVLKHNPSWASNSSSEHWQSFYKSGDLCSWNSQGLLEYYSRKDTQVKIRGLRVELSEVEHHILSNLPDSCQVVVGLLECETGKHLAAYVCPSTSTRSPGGGTDHGDLFSDLDSNLNKQFTEIIGNLGAVLPKYMIPSLFIPCNYMPVVTSSKLDRRTLQHEAMKLDRNQLEIFALKTAEKRSPKTEMERFIQEIWAKALNRPLDTIGCDDSFLVLGGDSITAINAVSIAREAGVLFTVNDIFKDPRLCSVASVATNLKQGEEQEEIRPFDLLPERLAITSWEEEARQICEISPR